MSSINESDSQEQELFKKIIEGDNYNIIHSLALMYYYGEGVAPNYNKAILLFEKAIEGHHTASMNFLGYMYYNGKGTKKNFQKAIDLFERAIERGNKYMWHTYFNLCVNDKQYERLDLCAYTFYLTHNSKELMEELYKGNADVVIKLKQENHNLKEQVEYLQEEVESLHNEIDYEPGKKGYLKARDHFNMLLYEKN